MPNQAIILQNVLQDMRKLLVVKPLNHDNIILMDLQTDLFDDVAPIQEEFEPFQDEIIPSDADSGYVPTTEEEAEETFLNVLFQVNLRKTKRLLVRLLQESRSLPALPVILQLFCRKQMFKRCFRNLSIRGV